MTYPYSGTVPARGAPSPRPPMWATEPVVEMPMRPVERTLVPRRVVLCSGEDQVVVEDHGAASLAELVTAAEQALDRLRTGAVEPDVGRHQVDNAATAVIPAQNPGGHR